MTRVEHAPVGVEHGDRLERLYREQGDRMWRAVLAFAGDPEVASDAVAEAFAQALRRGDAIRDAERWVWRTVFRIAAGELKVRARTAELGREGAWPYLAHEGHIFFGLEPVRILDMDTLEVIGSIPLASQVADAALDPATGTLWIANYEGTVTRIDLR